MRAVCVAGVPGWRQSELSLSLPKLLILDLDETLVHARRDPLTDLYGFRVGPYYVYRRPYLQECLAFCRAHFTCAVWTSASTDYAAEVVAAIFPAEAPPHFVWSRERCTLRRIERETERMYTENVWLKNLKKVKRLGWDLDQVLMLDNTPRKLQLNYGNLIPIRDFTGDPEDIELLRLMHYLPTLRDCDNVRTVEKRRWYREVAVTEDLARLLN